MNKPSTSTQWQFWIDRGGTFTDVIAKTPDGILLSKKLLSENPEHYKDSAVAAIREFFHLKAEEKIPVEKIACVKMGTTVATNALLERKGERVALFITKGFKDALRIAYQNRPHLFDRHIILPELMYQKVVEVDERIAANGEILKTIDRQILYQQLQSIYAEGFDSLAIVFMHGYVRQEHEKITLEIAKSIGFSQISVSHQVAPIIKLVSRGDTTVVDAYLSPILHRYIAQISSELPGVPLYFMQSSGGLTTSNSFNGKDAVLSGPAGGIVGMSQTALLAGENKVIGFDMGGTSTDVSHFAGQLEHDFESLVAGVRIHAPMINIHTVASGGGSILQYDSMRFKVGPQSAGANPGPACYRRGGPLTLTDANVLVGKIQANWFPKVFGPHGNQAIDVDIVKEKFAELSEISQLQSEEIAQGFIHIAVEQMANAIKKISVAKGYDVTQYTLQCFGGAGGQHACQVAEALGMSKVLIHPFAGLLSAYGMGLADQTIIQEQSIETSLNGVDLEKLEQTYSSLIVLGKKKLSALEQNLGMRSIKITKYVHLKYIGSDKSLVVPFGSVQEMLESFEESYLMRYAFLMKEVDLWVESISVHVTLQNEAPLEKKYKITEKRLCKPTAFAKVYVDKGWCDVGLMSREDIAPGEYLLGPAIITEDHSTTFVEKNWQACVTDLNYLELQKINLQESVIKNLALSTSLPKENVNPILLEVFNNLFMNIAEQMGLQLQNTAHSVNIKERLDFSCALFDDQGQLIANAPHMPVHLGSMGQSIKEVIHVNQASMKPGDVYVLNDPYHGGTHLPDITVITPIYEDDATKPIFYVGSRGHHADIGGISPGSMPPFSKNILEEGILINNFKLVENSKLKEQEIMALLLSTSHPSRNPQQNLADLKAQIAANEKGAQELKKMLEQYGKTTVLRYMQYVQDHAEESVRKAIGVLKNGEFTLHLDNGAQIKVAVRVNHQSRSAQIDFTGTSEQQNNNFNAPQAVTIAAVLYAFRTLVNADIPLNAGCLKPLEIIIPKGSMLNPDYPAAVVAGNVETSSCVTNALLIALGVMASSQPTMNNLTFGNATYQYYETISGGSGAGGIFDDTGHCVSGFDGTSVVQTHMTNSRLTDPEILEFRFPVELLSYEIRKDSGGKGQFRGGDGGIRKIKFLTPMTVSMLSNGKIFPAMGLYGGQAGKTGEDYWLKISGERQKLSHIWQVEVSPGDVIEIHTPGGGGFGDSNNKEGNC
jgi:5-oxoprolinase (ATP-hydrolysing)